MWVWVWVCVGGGGESIPSFYSISIARKYTKLIFGVNDFYRIIDLLRYKLKSLHVQINICALIYIHESAMEMYSTAFVLVFHAQGYGLHTVNLTKVLINYSCNHDK